MDIVIMSSSESTQSQDNTPKKSRVFKKGGIVNPELLDTGAMVDMTMREALQLLDKNDPSRFQGSGVNFRAKMIGIEDVAEARGDKMCQDAISRLKAIIKVSGEHKQRISINVSLDGLKILDERSGVVIHHHAVHKISFIARDVNDARAFGYIYGPGDGSHQFYGIKTDKAAESLVLTLRDLFQVVFEMKKREVEEAKKQKESNDNKENEQHAETAAMSRYRTPYSTLPRRYYYRKAMGNTDRGDIAMETGGGVGALLDLENELASISQGIQQMDEYGASLSGAAAPAAGGSPWGVQPNTLLAGIGAQHAHAASFPAQFGPSSASPQAGMFASSSAASSPPVYHQPQMFQSPAQQQSPALSASPSIFSSGQQLFVKLPPMGSTASPSSVTPAASLTAHRPTSIHTGLGTQIPPLPGPAASLGRQVSATTTTSVALHSGPVPQAPQGTQPPQGSQSTSWMTFDSPPGAAPSIAAVSAPAFTSLPPAVSQTPPPATANAFANSFSGDPFQADPFLTSTPQPSAPPAPAQNMSSASHRQAQLAAPNMSVTPGDKYSVFSGLDYMTSAGSGIEDTSVFGDASVTAPDPGGAVFNSAFASSPLQPEATVVIPPATEAPPKKLTDTPKAADPFSDLMSEAPQGVARDLKESPTKPTLLKLSQQSSRVASALAPPAADPFGGPVSPMTSAQLDKLVTVGETFPEDPFDTSSIKLKPSVGPFDTSQLRPRPSTANIPMSHAADLHLSQFEEEEVYSEITLPEITQTDQSLTSSSPPLPNQPPPFSPIPSQDTQELDVVPVLPPRGSPMMGNMRKQHTFDVGDINPPPLPRRPGSGGKGVVGWSSSLQRQQTIQFPMLPGENVAPPPPPPRTSATVERKRPPLNRAKTMPSPPPASDTPPPPPPRPHSPHNLSMFSTLTSSSPVTSRQVSEPHVSNKQHMHVRPVSEPPENVDPFAVTLPRSRTSSRGSGSSVSPSTSISRARPRPRPRPKTPAGTSSGLSLVGRSGSPLVAERPASSASLEGPNERKDSVSSSTGQPETLPHAVKFDAFSSHLFESSTDPAWPGISNTKSQSTSPKVARSNTPSTSSQPPPSHNESLQDPFANVDPFNKSNDDPFSSQPDPLNMDSPQDPFKKDFTAENQRFETKAITVDPDPFASNPFDNDDLFGDASTPSPIATPKENNHLHNVSGTSDGHDQDISVTNHSMFDFNSSNYQTSEASISIMSSDKSVTDTTISSERSVHTSLTQANDLSSENMLKELANSSTPPVQSTWTVFSNGTPSPTKANTTFNGDTASTKAWAAFPKDNGVDNVDTFSSSLSADVANCKDADSSSTNSEMAEAFGDDFSRASPPLPPHSNPDSNSQMVNPFGGNPFG